MFIDEAEILVKGGHGGAGRVSFFANRKGPSGGNGGRGGDVYAEVDANITQLKKFLEISKYIGENGGPGGQNKRTGLNGRDLVIKVPVNTTIIDKKTGSEIILNEKNPKTLLAKGGKGGLGNESFKTSTNRTPKSAELGDDTPQLNYKLLLKLIADYGLIGLPNAGKSSLLNVLTKANVKTAAYPFTTLEPNLGVFNGKVLADVPGLIEGAATGRGLGIKFLKHIEKVELLLHCIAVDSLDVEKDYKTVINELQSYSKILIDKKSMILLTKIDLANKELIEKKTAILKIYNRNILPISIYDVNSLDKLKKIITSV